MFEGGGSLSFAAYHLLNDSLDVRLSREGKGGWFLWLESAKIDGRLQACDYHSLCFRATHIDSSLDELVRSVGYLSLRYTPGSIWQRRRHSSATSGLQQGKTTSTTCSIVREQN